MFNVLGRNFEKLSRIYSNSRKRKLIEVFVSESEVGWRFRLLFSIIMYKHEHENLKHKILFGQFWFLNLLLLYVRLSGGTWTGMMITINSGRGHCPLRIQTAAKEGFL